MFIDTAEILVKAGNGGNGAVSFHREKYVTNGGPDGGDGGRGGHVIVRADDNMSSLMDFKYQKTYSAQNGENGKGRGCSGRDGADLLIRVPRGTLIRDKLSGKIIADISSSEPLVLCKGGRGGWGNRCFATATRQAPRFAKSGTDGQERAICLEIKLLADVGLAGFPNVGKSTLLSVISAARPKVADYHFTTLSPNLGLVQVRDDCSFVCADIPGLIKGASGGAGLGHGFLRHVDRCRLILHIIDASGYEGRDPCEDFDIIGHELAQYSPGLAGRRQIVVANKCDILHDRSVLERLRRHVSPHPLYAISGATGEGVKDLLLQIAAALAELPPPVIYEPEIDHDPPCVESKTDIRQEDGIWVVSGSWIERLMRDINFSDYESRAYFESRLQAGGVYEQLEALGVHEGDTVNLCGLEFDYVR
ncbi:MAG: GTPase ObgE [Oscillospiraceae bacterium]|nr:GTPase ObgE [Oscillospiraceae bacterium]